MVAEWEAFARSQFPAAHDLPVEALRDHAALMLRAFAADMASQQSDPETLRKSRGHSPGNAPPLTSAAHEHAMQRFAQGFTLNQMVSEYRALRAAVIKRWTLQLGAVTSAHLDELVRFGECVDQAVTESVTVHLEQVEQSRNLLLGVLGHDLRNPLGAVRMSAEYLLRSNGLEGPQIKAASRIASSANTMKKMVEDLLDFTETMLVRTMPLKRDASNLGDDCSDVVDELIAFHPGSTVHFAREGDLTGHWDASRVKQMVSNLTANAIQHGDSTKAVSILVRGQENEVVVEVHNEGDPIPAEARGTLFQPFVSQPSQREARHTGSSGLGLGLYIAHEIVVAHGGSIALTSTASDGTTFTVHLPRSPADG